MHYQNIPPLFPEEEKMPLSKYYRIPFAPPNPLARQLIDAGPCDPKLAVMPKDMERLISVDSFADVSYGYCMLPDGAGYVAFYIDYGPLVTPAMLGWYWTWVNTPPRGTVKGHGNIKYKLTDPIDHIEHCFVNGKDFAKGCYTLETLDLGAGEKPIGSVHHSYKLYEYGVPMERLQALVDAGGTYGGTYESFDTPGSHLIMNMSRVSARGTTERLSFEWIGYGVDTQRHCFVRDPSTFVDEAYLRKVLLHNQIEHARLAQILPELYAEYHDKEPDAD